MRGVLLVLTVLLGCATSAPRGPGGLPEGTGGSGSEPEPLLTCESPARCLALQQDMDIARWVASLDDWSAVRLGARGPVREEAASLLNSKRTAFLLHALERYGAPHTEVLALFVVHTAHDDDLREMLSLLARDKQLTSTLDALPAFQAALEQRGLKPSGHADRDFQWTDVGRGLARAGRDALSSTDWNGNAAAFDFSVLRAQLPPPYQRALDELEGQAAARHFSAERVVLGGADQLTFGVPLGFYGLVTGTAEGVRSLGQGEYEQATRELAPAALLVALYAGGRGARLVSEARGAWGQSAHALLGAEARAARWRDLKETARQLEARLGAKGLGELARYIQASREAGRFVAVGGMDAAVALHEARGDVARARPLLSKAKEGATGGGTATGPVAGSLAALVDSGAGLTSEVLRARLAAAEWESASPRLPLDAALLEQRRPVLESPPVGAHGSPRWAEYVEYYEGRLGEVRQGRAAKGPLPWAFYEQMRGGFARGLAFERTMVERLRADARLPRAERRFLGDFDKPRIETNVGVMKPGPGLRFVDVLVIEENAPAGVPRRVETFSFKSRNLSGLDGQSLKTQILMDAREALSKYGGTMDIRRGSLWQLLVEKHEVRAQRVRLVYEGGELAPTATAELKATMNAIQAVVSDVEVAFQ